MQWSLSSDIKWHLHTQVLGVMLRSKKIKRHQRKMKSINIVRVIAHLSEQHQEIQHTHQHFLLQFQEKSLSWMLRLYAEMDVRYFKCIALVLAYRIFLCIEHCNVQFGSDWKFSFHRFWVAMWNDMKTTKFMFASKKIQAQMVPCLSDGVSSLNKD